jgi:adenylate kinase family enzyme
VNRLNKDDCKNNGWVLDGFPIVQKDVEFLQKQCIVPNRIIWLNANILNCRERLLKRRYDPYSSRCVNLVSIPTELQNENLDKWIRAPNDSDEVVKQRFHLFESTEKTLKDFYGLRTETNETGVMHYLDNDGIGESLGDEPTLLIKKVFEVVEAHLLRPVPFSIK